MVESWHSPQGLTSDRRQAAAARPPAAHRADGARRAVVPRRTAAPRAPARADGLACSVT